VPRARSSGHAAIFVTPPAMHNPPVGEVWGEGRDKPIGDLVRVMDDGQARSTSNFAGSRRFATLDLGPWALDYLTVKFTL
jgi:hypothetical protein